MGQLRPHTTSNSASQPAEEHTVAYSYLAPNNLKATVMLCKTENIPFSIGSVGDVEASVVALVPGSSVEHNETSAVSYIIRKI